ncbi:MAG: hypothetical protein K2M75_06405 [Clostridia bacterium]|nr:hypothetical protein [Clostridia bacterium]
MKKKITVIMALVCIISMLVAFNACDGNNVPDAGNPSGEIGSGAPSGSVSQVNQIQQFRSVMTAVLNEFSGRLKNTASLMAVLSGESASGEDKGFEKPVALKEIYDYADTVEGKEVIEDKQINEFALRNFLATRAYGELICQICETNQIYGMPIEINSPNASPAKAYVVVLSKGTHITAYLYSNDEKDGENVYKWDIDYVSDSKFSAKMIIMSCGKPMYYVYGDTDGEAMFVSRNSSHDSVELQGEVQYKKSDSDECYSLTAQDAVKQCFAKVQYEFDSIDFKYLRALKDSVENTATQQQYDKIADALCKQYGID